MIRKMLVIAAAVAMPATVLAGISGAGTASATKPAPQLGSCVITGSVTFATPGISAGGAITSKTTESSQSKTTPSAGGFCGTSSIVSKIPTATTACWATLPVYSKTTPVGGTLASGAPSTCDVGGTSSSSDATISATTVKVALKDKYYYDTSGVFLSGGTGSIAAALTAKPIKLTNNTNVSKLAVTTVTRVLPGGVCAGDAGFQINGTDTFAGAGHVVIKICLSDDSGPSTTHNFVTDLLGPTATIATATIGGASDITYSA